MPPKKKKKTTANKFLKPDKLRMIAVLKEETYVDVYERSVREIQAGVHLKLYESRRKFVKELTCDSEIKQLLTKLLEAMVEKYIVLLQKHVKRKGFAHFQQAWLCHINEYFTEPMSGAPSTSTDAGSSGANLHSIWKDIVDEVKNNPSIEEQRIVVSTMAYTIYDLMSEKVKDHKVALAVSTETASSDSSLVTRFSESNVSLHRYGGFALHTLLNKYASRIDTVSTSRSGSQEDEIILSVLKQLKIKDSTQMCQLPDGIHYLNRGGLDIMNMCMLPYLRAVIEKVSSLRNEDMCQKKVNIIMIEIASKEVDDDADLFRTFVKCIHEAGVDAPAVANVVPRINKELSKKMFHARVNEFMTASIEIELEKSGKAVQAEQSLRDQLKTFSGLKTR